METKYWLTISVIIVSLFCHSLSQSICQKIIQYHQKNNSMSIQKYQDYLQELKNTLHDDCVLQLEPNYVWAQNMSFIMVKFDFDLSSRTSCTKLLIQEKNVTYQGFQLKRYCLQSNNLIKYQIKVKTYKNLNFHFSKWKSTEMNGLILQTLKSPSPYFWPKLYSESAKLKNKPKIWWQLQQKQDEIVQKYMGLLEIDQSEVEISSYVKKMRKRGQNRRKSSKSDIQFVIFLIKFSTVMKDLHFYLVLGSDFNEFQQNMERKKKYFYRMKYPIKNLNCDYFFRYFITEKLKENYKILNSKMENIRKQKLSLSSPLHKLQQTLWQQKKQNQILEKQNLMLNTKIYSIPKVHIHSIIKNSKSKTNLHFDKQSQEKQKLQQLYEQIKQQQYWIKNTASQIEQKKFQNQQRRKNKIQKKLIKANNKHKKVTKKLNNLQKILEKQEQLLKQSPYFLAQVNQQRKELSSSDVLVELEKQHEELNQLLQFKENQLNQENQKVKTLNIELLELLELKNYLKAYVNQSKKNIFSVPSSIERTKINIHQKFNTMNTFGNQNQKPYFKRQPKLKITTY